MMRVSSLAGVLVVLVGAACSTDGALPTDPVGGAPAANPAVSPAQGGFPFTLLEQEAAVATTDGTHRKRCHDSDSGHALLQLQLTAKQIGQMRAVLDAGGRVQIEVKTAYTLHSDGAVAYSQIVQFGGPGFADSQEHRRRAVDPGVPGQGDDHWFYRDVSAAEVAQAVPGQLFTVAAVAHAQATLRDHQCGDLRGGQASWRIRGAVVRLNP